MNQSRSWTDQMKWHKECGRWQKHNTGVIIIAIGGCAWFLLLQRYRGSWEWELSTSRWWRLELTLLLQSRRKSGGRQGQCGGLVLCPRARLPRDRWVVPQHRAHTSRGTLKTPSPHTPQYKYRRAKYGTFVAILFSNLFLELIPHRKKYWCV